MNILRHSPRRWTLELDDPALEVELTLRVGELHVRVVDSQTGQVLDEYQGDPPEVDEGRQLLMDI